MLTVKEEFVPAKGKKWGCMSADPLFMTISIWQRPHFHHFDVIRRYLCWRGYDVTFVQNFTDIDDKMIKRAGELGIPVSELAERYIEAYFADASFGCPEGGSSSPATEHIPK